jgi:hypothetical protein
MKPEKIGIVSSFEQVSAHYLDKRSALSALAAM